jgi:hypothetical protein
MTLRVWVVLGLVVLVLPLIWKYRAEIVGLALGVGLLYGIIWIAAWTQHEGIDVRAELANVGITGYWALYLPMAAIGLAFWLLARLVHWMRGGG